MNFASPTAFLPVCDTSDIYERISDDEFNSGMGLSDSSDGEESMEYSSTSRPHHWQTDSGSRSVAVDSRASSSRASVYFDELSSGRVRHTSRRARNVTDRPSAQWMTSEIKSVKSEKRRAERCWPSKERWFRQADTNVMAVDFGTLKKTGNMHAGDPVSCDECIAILSRVSKLTMEGEQKKWKCEFCGKVSLVDVEDEEIPKVEDVTYLLQPAMATSHSSISGVDKSLVIFCMDTSGSMCVTSEIDGRVRLRGNSKLRRLQSFNERQESQYLPNQRHDVTYVSRLQSMQAAVDHQLGEMQKCFPDRRVALIAFSNEVCVIGDGSQTEVTLAGDKLNNEARLTEESKTLSLPSEVKNSRKCLSEKVYKLEEGGATALGPALVVALSMASHHPGSKVIICTDGKANIGLGKMENDQDEESADEFYTNLGEKALQSGVTMSVITIQGTDCKLVHLGKLADKTGGQVNIVDPLKLQEEFSNILKDPIIATKVKATFILYKDLFVYDELNPKNQFCRAEKFIGNVTERSTITFQFAKRREADSKKSQDKGKLSKDQKDLGKQADPVSTAETNAAEKCESSGSEEIPGSLPFQLQIEYMDTEGNKALRVITRSLPVTSDRTLAERNVNLDVIEVHAARQSSDLALKGEYTSSRGVALMNQRLAYRTTSYTGDTRRYRQAVKSLCKVENTVHQQQMREIRSTGGHTYSSGSDDGEDSDIAGNEEAPVAAAAQPSKERKGKIAKHFASLMKRKSRGKKEERSREMSDDMAKVMYQALSSIDSSSRVPKMEQRKDWEKKNKSC